MRPLVLIIEDEVDAADVLSLVLEHWGYDTVVCHDGLQGYQLAVSMLPDIVLSDYNMPLMNGVELADKLSREPFTKSIPFILITARYETIHAIVNDGLTAVVKKPFDLKLLQEILAGIPLSTKARTSSLSSFAPEKLKEED